jgi:hypothetical protein
MRTSSSRVDCTFAASSSAVLAGEHILQGIERQGGTPPERAPHPIELFARAYGL